MARWCKWPEHRALSVGLLSPDVASPVTWQNSAGCNYPQGLLSFSRAALQSCSQGVGKAPTAVDF